jgi:DNA-binding NarL/FixJ family response regulator
LDLVVKGCTNREIGQDLFISEHTVKAHLSSIMTKLNIKNRQQAVAYIMQKRMKNSTGQQPV